MAFQKLNFKEVIDGDKTLYFISVKKEEYKEVNKEVYLKLQSDDSLFMSPFPPLPKTNNVPDDECGNNIINEVEEYPLEVKEELLSVIEDIRNLNDEEALDMLYEFIEDIKKQTMFESLSLAYNELANNLNKAAARMEINLENLQDDITYED